MSVSFNLKLELLKLIHEDLDINKALGKFCIFYFVFHLLTVECLANNIVEKVLGNPNFLDVAMRKIGSRMQQEHVPLPIMLMKSFVIAFQVTLMKAVEVRGGKDSKENTEDVETLARSHGFPLSLPKVVEEKFDDCANVFMKENFKSAIPVSIPNAHKIVDLTNVRSTVSDYGTTALTLGLPGLIRTIGLRSVVCCLQYSTLMQSGSRFSKKSAS